MYPSKLTQILAAALLLTNSVHGLGCFGSGLKYSDVTTNSSDLVSIRNDFCSAAAHTYIKDGSSTKCYSFTATGNRVDMAVQNVDSNGGTLNRDDCVSAMTIEMNGCDKGSKQKHNNFQYTDDPNAGAGNGCATWPPTATPARLRMKSAKDRRESR